MQSVKKYYVCDTETGTLKVKLSRLVNINLTSNDRLVKYDDVPLKDYFFDKDVMAIVPRKQFSNGEIINGEFIVQLPQGTKLLWQGERYTIDDGVAEIAIDQPGKHKITLIHPHYQTEIRYIENPKAN